MNLPEAFLKKMKLLLGEEYDAFLASFDEGRRNGLRVNRLRISPEQFEEVAPFALERVPWAENGYFVDYQDYPGQHPWYRAGVYYLQEPSAMAPAQILPVQPGDRVLDLCAAPGGKATELGARLSGEGILVANEISKTRVRTLERNLELFGIRNSIVTNESPQRLAGRFPEYFDAVLVDAPCSGEGMFRKNPEAVSDWSEEKVKQCAAVQREILLQAADMLRPGGYLVYSTCTFEPEEDELAVAYLLQERPDMELLEIPCTDGRATFLKAFSLKYLSYEGKEGSIDAEFPDLTRAVRIWPHRTRGEGHFVALLKKRTKETIRRMRRDTPGKEAGKKRKTDHCGQKRISKQEWNSITQFLDGFWTDRNIDISRCEIRDGHVYLMPEDCPDIRGLRFLRAGLYLGDLKKSRFEPSQELALALPGVYSDEFSAARLNGEICFRTGDERLEAFLRGETIRVESAGDNGWRLVCADRWPVGWGKLTGGILKNHIPAVWRSRRVTGSASC